VTLSKTTISSVIIRAGERSPGACLDPNAADYDCAGGSGDGPDHTGTVTDVGDDHFGLDRDGIGCQN
jgi:hypothetical protein